MSMTMSQKILAKKAGLEQVRAGQLIKAKLDMVLGNDITSPVAIGEFEKAGFSGVFDKERISMVMDHFTPNKDIKAAGQCKRCRLFAKEYNITNFYDTGEMGIEHCLLPEKGLAMPGDLIIGADSHTCTYGALGAFSTGVGSTDMAVGMATGEAWFKVPASIRFNLRGKFNKYVSGKDLILHIIGLIGVDGALYQSMEFGTDKNATSGGLESLTIDDRLCIANMAIEAGGKNGIFEVDEITLDYIKKVMDTNNRTREYEVFKPDADAQYSRVIDIDLGDIKSTVSFPHLPENTKTVEEIEKGEKIILDQVVIGSCTNGRISDMKVAAELIKGKKVKKGVRCIVIPGTQKIFLECMELGYAQAFVEAGCVFSTPTCGPCLGGHMGILAKGERALATTNRNFVGRMGHPESEVYLASPEVAAASALTGYISAPL
ncbi:MAG: 3-isopropylmalate dehydratase large subunit [Oscillospiraceae bacterium]|nr:3-isopropylmalate dehydratase large subunit [Oscillospiraceae bacterium]